ncbi:MAG TPA: methyltransferase domain-containing protein [Candidatus Bathyarchaeia archaeon]|jgi:protein-L-isoaspartate(D-aspartate) O-methyltransferase|nr:methyltransferase domain-containing protein [Candidatus Bathyarchaeia archaeon]
MMTIEDCREFYAQEVKFAASLTTPGLVKAFAKVPREKFLGPGPWQIGSAEARSMSVTGFGQLSYITVHDPRDVYHNVVISLDRAKDINNGQPGSLACWIEALALKPGERVYHLGCGVGYYTAIMAEVVGPSGSVIGLELQPDLAARAKGNLAGYSNVSVQAGDGAEFDPGECDAIFVNCGVTHPQTKWLERLSDGGRLVVPFTMAMNATIGQGVMTKITRSNGRFMAEMVSPVGIYSGGRLRDDALQPQLLKGLTTGGLLRLKSVRMDAHEAGETCVVHTREVCLSLAEAK